MMKWTEERTAKVKELVAIGRSARQIAKETGVSPGAIVGLMHRRPELGKLHGKTGGRRLPVGALSAAEKVEAYCAQNHGRTASQVASAIGVNSSTVRKAARRLGIKLRPGKPGGVARPANKTNRISVSPFGGLGFGQPAEIIPSVSSANLNEMVADWFAKNGAPRRFNRGESADAFVVRGYLKERGYTLQGVGGNYRIGNSPKRMPWSSVMTFVDELRMAEGLQPFRARTAA